LLSLPVVLDKIKCGVNLKESVEDQKALMLQTIKFPNNLQYLTDKLPKANYEPIKVAVLSNFDGFSGHVNRSEGSALVRNRSATSKANNRSIIHDSSQHLPSIPPPHPKRKQPSPVNAADQLIKDRINKQHDRVEQQIKKYDEILKKNKNIHQLQDIRKRVQRALLQENSSGHNDSQIHGSRGYNGSVLESSILDSGKRDMKIQGVRLESKADYIKGRSVPHDSSILHEDSIVAHRYNKLPALKLSSGHRKRAPERSPGR
jgi:hypothetical protein